LPETEAVSREVLSLPMYPELTDEQADYVVQTMLAFYKR
jgi:dTDP-4-amino-4,6-dideoxygalactose transaminase